MGLGTMLLGIFITLKLCGVLTWSWWWVLSPLYATLVYCIVIAWLAVSRDEKKAAALRRRMQERPRTPRPKGWP